MTSISKNVYIDKLEGIVEGKLEGNTTNIP